jgi:hypothetical protein
MNTLLGPVRNVGEHISKRLEDSVNMFVFMTHIQRYEPSLSGHKLWWTIFVSGHDRRVRRQCQTFHGMSPLSLVLASACGGIIGFVL